MNEKRNIAQESWSVRHDVQAFNVSYVMLILCAANVFYKVIQEKQLSLDGVSYFVTILETHNFIYLSESRRFAEYLTEWPLVIAVRAGIRDVPILVKIFGLGYLIPYLISFSGCIFALRGENKSLLMAPIASFVLINVTGDYLFIGEHHVMVALSWPILFLLLRRCSLTWADGILLLFITGIFIRTYETGLIAEFIFVTIIVVRFFKYPSNVERFLLLALIVILAVGITTAVANTIEPRSLINRNSFIDAISVNRKIKEVTYLTVSLLISCTAWLIINKNKLKERYLKNIVCTGSLIPVAMYVYERFNTDYALTAYWSFSSRTLSVLVLPLMLVLAAVIYRSKSKITRYGEYLIAINICVILGFNLIDTDNWIKLRREITSIVQVEGAQQFISIENTKLKDNHFRFSWNNSLLSAVWSYPCVTTIILNGPDSGWQPYDPEKTLILKEYLRYGENFLEIDPAGNRCEDVR